MPIPIRCQDCAAKFNVKDSLEGKLIRCPICQAKIIVTRPPANPQKERPSADEEADSPVKDPPILAKKPTGWSRKRIILVSIGGVLGFLCVLCMAFGIYTEQSNKNAFAYNQKM